jgi:hypothetical protein
MSATTTNKYAQLAAHLADRLERRTRRDGSTFFAFRDSDGFTEAVARAAHEAIDGSEPRLPSDWVYNVLSEAIDAITDNGGDIDDASRYVMERTPFIGYSDAFRWLASDHHNLPLVDDVADECGGSNANIVGATLTHNVWAFANEAVNLATVRVIDVLVEIADGGCGVGLTSDDVIEQECETVSAAIGDCLPVADVLHQYASPELVEILEPLDASQAADVIAERGRVEPVHDYWCRPCAIVLPVGEVSVDLDGRPACAVLADPDEWAIVDGVAYATLNGVAITFDPVLLREAVAEILAD